MLSIEDLESACDSAQRVEPSPDVVEPAELPFQAMYYPFGFPAQVMTNSEDVLLQYEQIWGKFSKQHDTEPMRVEVQVVEGDATSFPPEPSYRFMQQLMMCVADPHNYSMVDVELCHAKIVISRAALKNRLYAQHFLLGTPVCCVATRYTTPIHAACVALDGRGVLMCGDSGVGKSSLSYACARAGWTYISDDASFLLTGGTKRQVAGNCYQFRFRPSAAQLFPEIEGLEITPRAAGKLSIELPTAQLPHIKSAQSTRVDFIVFLKHSVGSSPQLMPYRRDVARRFMRQALYGSKHVRATQQRAIERLLTADVLELRYTDLQWAIDRLRLLVREGR